MNVTNIMSEIDTIDIATSTFTDLLWTAKTTTRRFGGIALYISTNSGYISRSRKPRLRLRHKNRACCYLECQPRSSAIAIENVLSRFASLDQNRLKLLFDFKVDLINPK